MNEATLEGRVALVTGAGGGLGGAICRAFAKAGATVVGVDVAPADGDDATIRADVGTVAGTQAMVDETLRRHGRLDVLVLNAGNQRIGDVADLDEDAVDDVLAVNLKGPMFACKAAWPALTARPGGRIVVTSSLSAFLAERGKAPYVAAKTGLLGLVRTLALEGAAHGLTANAVAPALMRTPLVEGQLHELARRKGITREEVVAELLGYQPVARFIEVEEVAAVLLFLASPAASAVSGVCVPVDLGALAG